MLRTLCSYLFLYLSAPLLPSPHPSLSRPRLTERVPENVSTRAAPMTLNSTFLALFLSLPLSLSLCECSGSLDIQTQNLPPPHTHTLLRYFPMTALILNLGLPGTHTDCQ